MKSLDILNNIENITAKTKTNYHNLLKRLDKKEFRFPLGKKENDSYVNDFLNENYPKIQSRLDLLNIVIKLRGQAGLEVEKLKKLRSEYTKQRNLNNIDDIKELKKELLTYDEFKNKLDEAFNKKEYIKYIINYLMLIYGVRNQDLDLIIGPATDDNKNYLTIKPGKILYTRNQYKTANTYGKQTHEITDTKFIKAVKALNKELGEDKKLFNNKQIANDIKKYQINKHSESDIFKLIIDHYYQKEDTEAINKLSESRGTSINTIKSFYNINSKVPIIREL